MRTLTSTCSAIFTVNSSPVILTCPAPRIEAPCQTQSAINTKFAAWIATASGSGG